MSHKKCHHSGVECLIHILETICDCDCNCHCNEIDGCIALNQGNHEITVKTDCAPSEVFLAVRPVGTPVCVGEIDMVGYSLLPDGFILYADIRSNMAEVCYIVRCNLQ